jgi:hypothetical protein
MTDIAGYRIAVRYSSLAEKWLASLEGEPQVEFRGELPLIAMRRLLESLEADPGEYTMHWIQPGDADGDASYWTANWQPPELLYKCPECDGKGYCGDLTAAILCRKCGGRGALLC